jgi:hypothetical protein
MNIFGPVGQNDQNVKLQASDLAAADLKGARRMKYRSLPRMVLYAARRVAITYFFVIVGWIFQIVELTFKMVKANSLLLFALTLSLGFNFFFTSKDSWSWWQERQAGKYMARLGVHPNTAMGRTIWLKDVEEFATDSGLETFRQNPDAW